MRLQLPAAVNMIIDVLQAHGYEGFAVGGCVRDSVLNRTPDDWDITTSATPYQVKELFPKTVDTGLQHGTVTVMVHGVGYEVTTYRIDGEYEDGRHPKEVQFTSNLTEDLKRRDFTINAMAYNETEGLIDIFMEAGAIVMNPNCSVCWGSCQGVIGENEVLISTGTRNFKGRAGHPSSKVYLGSAATVTASAIAGKIALPSEI